MVGEIGSNDYNYALFQGKSIQEAKQMVPQVVGVIAIGVKVSFLINDTAICASFMVTVTIFW